MQSPTTLGLPPYPVGMDRPGLERLSRSPGLNSGTLSWAEGDIIKLPLIFD